jgi:hypothetical protein
MARTATAQLCKQGHIQHCDGSPFNESVHCTVCGSKCIDECMHCQEPIRGADAYRHMHLNNLRYRQKKFDLTLDIET